MNSSTQNALTRVAIQGTFGAFHEIAARNYHQDAQLQIIPNDTFEQLVRSVEAGQQSDEGIMAIENSIAGSLLHNYNLLNDSRLHITGEVFLRIRHQLMGLPGQSFTDLKEVHSHPMAIAQCRHFFTQHPDIKLIESTDTAISARWISEEKKKGIAAIGSRMAARHYDLEIIAPGIETNKQNYTRFLILEKTPPEVHIPNEKISMSFVTDHRPGALHEVLGSLFSNGANLTKIQSMPILGENFHYRFFVDFTLADPNNFDNTVKALEKATEEIHILGTYLTGNYHDS